MNKSFEDYRIIYFILGFVFIFFVLCMSILFRRNIYLYKSFNGTYSNKYIGVFVSKKELDYFYRNSFIFIDGEKIKYEVYSVDSNVLKRKGVFYSYLLLSSDKKFEEGEIVLFSILERKEVNYKIFRIIWR